MKQKYADSSVDELWEVVDAPWTDRYVIVTTAIWQTPKAAISFPLLFILHLPVLIVLCIYLASLPEK